MAISTNQKPTIYRNLYENTGPGLYVVLLFSSGEQSDEADRIDSPPGNQLVEDKPGTNQHEYVSNNNTEYFKIHEYVPTFKAQVVA